MKKRLLSLALALTLCFGLTAPALALEASKVGQGITVSAYDNNIGVVDANGSLWMCGSNSSGQLGIGEPTDSTTAFVKVMDNAGMVQCGESITVAVKTDGSLWAWGKDIATIKTLIPKKILTPQKVMDNVAFATCARDRIAAIKTDGSLWMWGDNSRGQLGNGTIEDSKVPVKVMDDVATVSCNDSVTAAIKTDGSLWVWGEASGGMLTIEGEACNYRGTSYASGTDVYFYYYYQTIPIKVMDDVAAVSCTLDNVAAIKTDGSLWLWGSNSYGQLLDGYAGTFRYSLEPRKVMDNVTSVSGGYGYIAAVTADGSLWAWGNNSVGQLGNNYTSTHNYNDGSLLQLEPDFITDDVVSVACGFFNTVVTKNDGSIWTCGMIDTYSALSNASNQYGIPIQTVPAKLTGVTAKLSSPVAVVAKVGGFSDVLETDYYADPVLWAVKNKITSGTGDGTTFSPNDTCTQAQIITFLWRAAGSPGVNDTNPFSSVKETDYFHDAVVWAYANKIIDNSFSPHDPCTRANAVTYMFNDAGKPKVSGTNKFTDVAANASYANAVQWALDNGVTSGTGDGTTFSPDATCTRGQIVTFLYRAVA